MAIRKNAPNYLRKTKQPFTTLLNKTLDLIPDAAAIGIYVYLSSKQNDWIIQEKDLMNRFGVGRDFIRSRMKILKDVGLIIKQSVRDDKGKIVHWETTLLNEITENPSSAQSSIQITENPESGKPSHLDKPTHINKRNNEINNINIFKNISTSGEMQSGLSENREDGCISMDGAFLGENCELSTAGLPLSSENLFLFKNQASQQMAGEGNTDNKRNYSYNCDSKTTHKQKKEHSEMDWITKNNPFSLPHQFIEDWIKTRKKKRAPVTKTAWDKINKELYKCEQKGVDPIEAFETMVASGWQSLKAEYFDTPKTKSSSSASSCDALTKLINQHTKGEIYDQYGNTANYFG